MAIAHAVLFDIDGTLVDSNYLHVDAWQRAFERVGHPVDAWRIHRSIGMDSAGLLDDLLGSAAATSGHAAATEHSEIYRTMTPRLRAFDGAGDLLDGLRKAGRVVVLATSAPADELEILLRVLGDPAVVTTNADDVDVAKPHPGIVQVALERAGAAPEDSLFVGDSVWDMVAANTAGVRSVGVRTGGVGADELMAAGAVDVLESVAQLTMWESS